MPHFPKLDPLKFDTPIFDDFKTRIFTDFWQRWFSRLLTAVNLVINFSFGKFNVLSFGAKGDGVHDDTAAFIACLAEGDMWIPGGGYTFLISDQISVPSNRQIWMSWGSVIKMADMIDRPIFYLEDVSNVLLDGIRLDGNKINQINNGVGAGVLVRGGDHISILNARIENTPIESILISKNETSGQIPEEISVKGCMSVNPSRDATFRQHYAVTAGRKIAIENNIAESTDNFAAFMVVLEPNNATNPIEDVIVSGNVGRFIGGVALTSSHGRIIKRVAVCGNSALGTGAGRGSAYIIKGCENVAFTGNVGENAGLNALAVEDSHQITINGFIFNNYAIDLVAGQEDGIQLTSSTSVTISGNTLQSTNAGAYGIRETDAACITYVGNNRLDVAAANQVSLQSVNSVQIWRRFDKDANLWGNLNILSTLGSSAQVELGWTSSDAIFRPSGGATLEVRPTTILQSEIADPAAPAAGSVIIYARDNGGKTELAAVFNTGAVQQIAIEP